MARKKHNFVVSTARKARPRTPPPMGDRRTKRNRTRGAQLRSALAD